jgi:hypothetical protein
MLFKNYRKETSERSDELNWAKKLLIENTPLLYDSIEGCNENKDNVVTNLFERARVDIDNNKNQTDLDILNAIVKIEGKDCLSRKIRFANCFGINLNYVIYCDESKDVFLYEISALDNIKLLQHFNTYVVFSEWIANIKGWKSRKKFREKDDLPLFDKELRKAGTAWPINIDCFITNSDGVPTAILEFQNSHDVTPIEHCNNNHFWGITKYDDQRRWLSQDILRVHSGLRFFIIVWSAEKLGFIFKEVEKVVSPHPIKDNGNFDYKKFCNYKKLLQNYIRTNKLDKYFEEICKDMTTFELDNKNGNMNIKIHIPPISIEHKTFPMIYYKEKISEEKDNSKLLDILNDTLII